MLDKIYLAVNTSSLRNSGTKSDPVLIISNGSYDLLHHTFDIDGGLAENTSKLLELDVKNLNLPGYLGQIRLGIRGADAWRPDKVFVWGERTDGLGIDPIAVKMWSPELSTDEDEGRLSIPLNRAYNGGTYTRLRRMVMVIQNDDKRYAGTKSTIRLEARTKDSVIVDMDIESGLAEEGASLLEVRYINGTFRFNDLRSITLEIKGDDAWIPKSLMIFGLDDRVDERESLVPLVYIPDWKAAGLGQMSSDPKEGNAREELYRAFL